VHTEKCLYDCYSEGTTILHENSILFEDFEFWEGNDHIQEIKVNSPYKIFIKEEQEHIFNRPITKDVILNNGTVIKEVIGYDEEITTYDKWIKYDFRELSAGIYEWRLEVKKEINKDLDWVGTVRGQKLNQWAWFDAYDGIFEVFNVTGYNTWIAPSGITNISVLVVGGGGSGGGAKQGIGGAGGGGAGGLVFNNSYTVTPSTTYNIWVGTGGPYTATGPINGNNGTNSTFDLSIAYAGGGGGHGSFDGTGVYGRGYRGASGGGDGSKGGGQGGGADAKYGSQGNDGGTGIASPRTSGGGGGHSAAGGTAGGGAGSTIWSLIFAGGGGGGGETGQGAAGSGGIGGGGDGTIGALDGLNGTDGYGGGGGGAGLSSGGGASTTGGKGGDGIVIIRYLSIDNAPTVTQSFPVNNTIFRVNNVVLSATISDDIGLDNSSIYVDGNLNITNSSLVNGTQWNETIGFGEGVHNVYYDAWDNISQVTVGSGYRFRVNTTPVINTFSPLNQSYSISTIYFNATSDLGVDQWIANYNGTNTTLSGINTSLGVEDGDHQLLLYGRNAVSGKYGLNDTIYFIVDTTTPTVNDASNITDLVTFSLPVNSTWNYTVNDAHLDSCYYNTSENAALTLVTCNTSAINTTWTTEGNKTIQYFANDTGGLETSKVAYLYVYFINYTQTDDPDPVGEGTNVTFDLNVSLTNISIVTATFRLNDTYYDPDTTTATTDYYYFTKVVTIPDTYGNATGFPQSWLWNYTISGVIANASTSYTDLTVYELAIDNCTTYTDPILNLSLKDEEANTLVNGSAGSTIELDLRLTSFDDPTVFIDYSRVWTNVNETAVCIPTGLLSGSEYQIDFTIGYQATDKVWEFFYLDDGVLNSTKIFDAYTDSTIDLMDLITADSTSFLFNFFNVDGLPIDNSVAHVFRKYIGEGIFREVERGKADENGDTVIHLVEEDVIYYFVITDNGDHVYTSSTYTALCQTTPCTIVLEASGDSAEFPTDWDLLPDGNFSINSSVTTRGVSMVYNFDTSTDVNFTIYKYESDGSYSSVVTDSDTGTSGIMTLAVPLSAGNVSFFSTVYVDGEFVTSEWIDFSEKATDYFGQTMSLFLAALLVLTLGLIAVSEGAGVIVFVIIGVFISGALGLINTRLNTGISILVFLIISGGLIIWKLTGGRK